MPWSFRSCVGAVLVTIGLTASVGAAGAAAPAAQGDQTYSDAATWNWFREENQAAVSTRCQIQFMGALNPGENPGHAGCIVAAMRTTGANEAAIRFFETTRLFLAEFEEAGRIDLGHAGAPWSDMGRGEMVFLNGSPSVIPLGFALDLGDDSFKDAPAYADIRQRYPNAFPWSNHAGLHANDALPGGSQRFTVVIPLRDCRACEAVAIMPVALTFDAAGVLVARDILPPTAP
jgi:hypothetical protein